jgi:hypothetical protein
MGGDGGADAAARPAAPAWKARLPAVIILIGLASAVLLGALVLYSRSGPPTVESTSPSDGASDVALDLASVSVRFTEDMDRAPPPRGAVRVSFASCKWCGIDYSASWEGPRELEISLLTPVPPGREVEVTLFSADFKDAGGTPMHSTHTFRFSTRAFAFAIANEMVKRDSGDYVVSGEVENREQGVMAPYLWKNGSAGAAGPVLALRATYLDSAGSKLGTDFCLTPLLIALKTGDALPFRCVAYDPDSKIASHQVEAALYESLPLLWKVTPHELALEGVAGGPAPGSYNASGELRNAGARQFANDTLRVVLVVYRADGKVLDYAEHSNVAPVGPGGIEKFALSLKDPSGDGNSHAVLASIFHP